MYNKMILSINNFIIACDFTKLTLSTDIYIYGKQKYQ